MGGDDEVVQEDENKDSNDLMDLQKLMEDEIIAWNAQKIKKKCTKDRALVLIILECQVVAFSKPKLELEEPNEDQEYENEKEANVINEAKLEKGDDDMEQTGIKYKENKMDKVTVKIHPP